MGLNLPGNTNQITAGEYTANVFNNLRKSGFEQEKQKLENKYKPIEIATKAQNALSYSNRMGNLGLFLRGISQMPVAERQAYLADPANRENYKTMLEEFRQGIKNPSASGNLLTPELLAQAGLGGMPQQQRSNPFNSFYNWITGNNQQQQRQHPPLQSQPSMQDDPKQNNMPNEYGAVNQATDEEVDRIANQSVNDNEGPTVSIGGHEGTLVPEIGTGYTPEDQQRNLQQKEQNQQEQPKIPVNKELTPKERDTLNAQLRTNNSNVGTDIKKRADSAIAFDKFLQLHRKEISEVFRDAFKYSQLYGRGKNWLEKFKQNQPKEYVNYITAKNSLTPLLANGVRFLEAMGVSHDAQQDSRQQIASALDALDQSPETAIKVFNNHMRALGDVSQGVLTSAEPAYPGVRRKLAGVPHFKGDFIENKKRKYTDIDIKHTAKLYGISENEVRKRAGL